MKRVLFFSIFGFAVLQCTHTATISNPYDVTNNQQQAQSDRSVAGSSEDRDHAFSAALADIFGFADPLSDRKLSKYSSAPRLIPESLQVIKDNDVAFISKLNAVKNAKSSLQLAYFIYATDHSSSLFTKELIAVARRGVKVQLLVDYHTNYKRLDFFSMMEREGAGNLEVRFYGRPTRNIVLDAAYLTSGCGEEIKSVNRSACSTVKLQHIDQYFKEESAELVSKNISNLNTGGSGLFLSGLYSKDPEILSLAVMKGQSIDLNEMKKGASASAEEKEQLKKVAKIAWGAVSNKGITKLYYEFQLWLAFQIYGDKLNPLANTLTGYLPLTVAKSQEYLKNKLVRTRDWAHLTDYLHHKILLADSEFLQLGGRNIEDSYHMAPNEMVEKYVFMDTDVATQLRSLRIDSNVYPGGYRIASAYNDIWNFRPMVATLAEVRQHAPNEMAANLAIARAECKDEAATQEDKVLAKKQYKDCMQAKNANLDNPISLDERMNRHKEAMERLSTEYTSQYFNKNETEIKEKSKHTIKLSDRDKSQVVLGYIENLPFLKDAQQKLMIRGSVDDAAAKHGKYIHELWALGLKNVCAKASKEHPQDVILHSAYFFPSSHLMEVFAQMADGTLDCANVKVSFLTNSFYTTDLNVVNILAEHSMKALFDYIKLLKHPTRGAEFKYYEYKNEAAAGGKQKSLHTKITVLGDTDMIVGSANADIRSYMMDSNNGVFIRNARELIADYASETKAIMNDSGRVQDITDLVFNTPRAQIIEKDKYMLKAMLQKYKVDQHPSFTKERYDRLERDLLNILEKVYQLSVKSVSTYATPVERDEALRKWNNSDQFEKRARKNYLQQQYQNQLDQLFKPI